MVINKYFIYFLFLLFPVLITAQTPSDFCYVSSHWRRGNQVGSNYQLGEFHPSAFDDLNTKSFTYVNTNLIITISVEYEGRYDSEQKGKPKEIYLALSVSDKEIEDAFDSIDNVVARTNYSRRWGKLSVEKQVAQGDTIYTFALICSDGTKINRKA